jgi:hypothetical protein
MPADLYDIFVSSRCHIYSSVGIVVGYRLDGWGSNPGRGTIFLFSTTSRPALWSIQPHIQRVPGVSSTVIKWPGHEGMVELYLHSPICLHGIVFN